MRATLGRILASSVNFTATTPAFSTSGQVNMGATTANSRFGSQGSLGGPTQIDYMSGVGIQGNFGNNAATSAFPSPAGTFNLLGSNTLEKSNFVVIASSVIGSTGSVILRDGNPWYRYADFQFIPNASMGTSAGFLTVLLTAKGISG